MIGYITPYNMVRFNVHSASNWILLIIVIAVYPALNDYLSKKYPDMKSDSRKTIAIVISAVLYIIAVILF